METLITVVVDDSTLATIDALAAVSDQSRDAIVAKAISDLVELDQWQTGQIKKSLAAAEAGDFANDDAVNRIREKFR
jgi:predicted transcriptional regulator